MRTIKLAELIFGRTTAALNVVFFTRAKSLVLFRRGFLAPKPKKDISKTEKQAHFHTLILITCAHVVHDGVCTIVKNALLTRVMMGELLIQQGQDPLLKCNVIWQKNHNGSLLLVCRLLCRSWTGMPSLPCLPIGPPHWFDVSNVIFVPKWDFVSTANLQLWLVVSG